MGEKRHRNATTCFKINFIMIYYKCLICTPTYIPLNSGSFTRFSDEKRLGVDRAEVALAHDTEQALRGGTETITMAGGGCPSLRAKKP